MHLGDNRQKSDDKKKRRKYRNQAVEKANFFGHTKCFVIEFERSIQSRYDTLQISITINWISHRHNTAKRTPTKTTEIEYKIHRRKRYTIETKPQNDQICEIVNVTEKAELRKKKKIVAKILVCEL